MFNTSVLFSNGKHCLVIFFSPTLVHMILEPITRSPTASLLWTISVVSIISDYIGTDASILSFTGRPEPNVKWWRGETLIDTGNEGISHQYSTGFTSVRQNKLTINSLSRYDQGVVYTCQASNSKMSPPVSASVTIEMFRE